MMNSFNNWFSSISAYADMSPDLAIRAQVNQWMQMRMRQDLGLSAWCRLFTSASENTQLLTFVYQRFSQYSGLTFGRVRKSDRLHSDLHFALVCWHDWVITFCEDFCEQFHVDLSDCFDEDDFETIGELVAFLDQQLAIAPERTEPVRLHVVQPSALAS